MDDELKRYLDTMQTRLMQQINDGHERILDRFSTLEKDFMNTKDFIVGDSLVASRRWLDLEARVSKLERKE
ncbi:MAG TPA: hypothetical protein VKI44_34560 [Acetobacteraceae bacterium]|nr:hypothetical protein [Acetobacteraceae bacterium]